MSGKIDDQLFEAHEHALENDSCPLCHDTHNGVLILRHGKLGPFLSCNRYPDCDYIKPLHSNDGHIVKLLGVPCPKCENELVLRQGRYGMFIGCSGYPDCDHIESLDQSREKKIDSYYCPVCSDGHLVERKSRFGKIFWACNNYPECKFAINQHPVNGVCENCGFPLLIEKSTTKGKRRQCTERKCQHVQSD